VRSAWSPEQIAGRWTFRTGEPLSKDTVYRFVRSARPEYVKKHFRRRGKRYVDRFGKRTAPHGKRRIGERPAEVESRTVIGHWEGDTVLGIRGGPSKRAILTNVERVSGYLLAGFLNGKNGECVAETTLELFQGVPESKRKTMTYDNGSEFAEYWYVEEFAGMDVYFANPYHSWERGTNENTNGLLRQFVPKGADLAGFRKSDLAKAVRLLNNRPRKRLGYLTPHEVFVRGIPIPKQRKRDDSGFSSFQGRSMPSLETLTIEY
jgi:IS30 family transposase